MPATEQTWRNQKKLHVIFAVSTLVMAIATVVMMMRDHNREWKRWQLKDRRKDAWMIESRRDSLADQYSTRMNQFTEEIRKYDSQAYPPNLIDKFKKRVEAEDQRLHGGGDDKPSDDRARVTTVAYEAPADSSGSDEKQFRPLDEKVQKLSEAAAEVETAQAEVDQLKAQQAAPPATPGAAEGAAAEAPAENAAAQPAPVDPEQQQKLAQAEARLHQAQDRAIAARKEVVNELGKFIREARRRENKFVSDKKAINGVRTAKVSELGIKVGEGADRQAINKVQGEINDLDDQLRQLTDNIAAAKNYRLALEGVLTEADAPKSDAVKEVETMKTDLARLDDQVYHNTSNFGEWITRLPVLNALYSGNIRIEQNWLPDLTINYNFKQVARFDRCTTCHRAISKTAAGSATQPLYPTIPDAQRDITMQLPTPEAQPTVSEPQDEEAKAEALKHTYGLVLSRSGIIEDYDVTVHYVLPESPAAKAGLLSGDVIAQIGDAKVYSPIEATERLLTLMDWGKPAMLTIRRGLDHPFTAHPRLDLYLTDSSPHPQKDVGCTICHDGQGSGTSFPWTSHTPNDVEQEDEWRQKYGWFDNHHWIFPMKPARFVESNCLKCHHEKGSLEPSERFPEPPAPKLVAGWTTVEKFGCYGCHEINGYDNPTTSVGPDLRLEPAYYEAASQMLNLDQQFVEKNKADNDKGQAHLLSGEQRRLAETVRNDPTNSDARHDLFASFKPAKSGEASNQEDNGEQAKTDASASAELQTLANLLKDVEVPGQYRKVGPSLRFVGSKVDYDWLYSWIRKPSDFRSDTRMPQFFLQYEHLSDPADVTELAESQKFEPIEIRAIAEYLLKASNKFEYEAPPKNVTEQPSAERGKWVFQSRGCLACHSHKDFPGIHSTQGPDLSELRAKLNNEKGRQWTYSWVKQPNRYHVRTKMPDLFLDPIEEKDPQGKPTGKVIDPAADVVAYLLGVESTWTPQNVPPRDEWTEEQRTALAELAEIWLASDAIPRDRAREYLKTGIPQELEPKLKSDEKLLVGLNDENRVERQLQFVARRTIGKYGCFGCHDIPGFEDAKPIGTALVDWGRKETSKLAFENIHRFLETHGINPENPTYDARQKVSIAAKEDVPASGGGSEVGAAYGQGASPGAPEAEAHIELDPDEFSADESYFIQSLNSHARDGFLWQKLRYPRSYDYKTTRNKNFNERLRMPRFPFNDQQREEVMTFVLGLVKEPPAAKYLYKPDSRQKAIVEGRKVLDRFNCAGCHTLRQEQWEFDYADSTFDEPAPVTDYPFLAPEFTDQEINESKAKDYRGMHHARVFGHPVVDDETGAAIVVDQDRAPVTPEDLKLAEAEGEPIPTFYRFTLWQNALINGTPRLRGVDELLIPAKGKGPANGSAYPAWGGDLARYLYAKVIAKAKETNPQVNGREAWGWLPPPLMDEGRKVQTDWLHGFLMDPYAIRPAVVLRMPNFHMSSDEAATLVNYFAAMSDASFPYEYRPHQRQSYLAQMQQDGKHQLGDAMKIVTNGNYCVKCHSVADFTPQGDPNTFGPNLAGVYHRLRPEFTRDWIANPQRMLPYTGMPVNIPYRPGDPHLGGISQELYSGTSLEQLTGLVDLLMNFDTYARGSTSVTPMVQRAAAAAAQQAAAGASPSSEPGAPASAAGNPPQ